MTKRHEIARPDDDRPALTREEAGEIITEILERYLRDEDDEDEFDSICGLKQLGEYIAMAILR